MGQRLEDCRHRLAVAGSRLDGLSPLLRISGGFGFVTDRENRRLETVLAVAPGDEIRIRLRDGQIMAAVQEIRPEASGIQSESAGTPS